MTIDLKIYIFFYFDCKQSSQEVVNIHLNEKCCLLFKSLSNTEHHQNSKRGKFRLMYDIKYSNNYSLSSIIHLTHVNSSKLQLTLFHHFVLISSFDRMIQLWRLQNLQSIWYSLVMRERLDHLRHSSVFREIRIQFLNRI